MKQLFLIRHGEAVFSAATDTDRVLTEYGKAKISRIGNLLAEKYPKLDQVYCSTAERTRQTAQILRERIPCLDVVFYQEIYDGDLEDLLGLLENCPDTASSLLIVGHNPLISMLASKLSDGAYLKLNPGDLVHIEFPLDSWKLITLGSGILREVMH